MKAVKIIAISVLALAALTCAGASADQPATRPAANSLTNSQTRRALRALVGKTSGVAPYTQQEWDEMLTFMEQYSPARAHVLETIQLPHESPIRLDAIRKWRNYKFTSEHFPTIADGLLRRFTLEDDLFDLTLKARADDGSEAVEIHDLIRAKIGQIVDLEFAEQQARVDRLQKLLDEEKDRLSSSQLSREDLIDRRTNMIIRGIEKGNPNLAPPATTRPDGPTAAGDTPVPASNDPVLNMSDPTNSNGK
jgi:hypothetical protein